MKRGTHIQVHPSAYYLARKVPALGHDDGCLRGYALYASWDGLRVDSEYSV